MFNYKNGRLYCENVPIENIAAREGTPLYIYSRKKLLENFTNYDKAFSGVPHTVCFAIKANSNYSILKAIASRGGGADVTSEGELYRALNAGIKPGKIVFAGVGKSEKEIEYALRENILLFNSESIQEIELINKCAGRLRRKPRIAIRVNPDVDPHTHRHISTGRKETKFGISMKEAVRIYLKSGLYRYINLCGIHCHIGSQITSVEPFMLMAKKINELAGYIRMKGIKIEYINIGGGLGVRYNNENPPTPGQLAAGVLPYLKEFKAGIVLEPGRYIIANTCVLVTKVLYHKQGESKKFLIVDAGMNDIIRPTLYDAYHDIMPVVPGKQKKEIVDVVGPICETGDFIGKDRALPPVERGGLLAVGNAGAYCFTMSSQYNSRRRAAEVMVDGNKYRVIRRRETLKDLIATEVIKR